MVKARTLTQNTTLYTAALVFQKVMAFVFFTFLARGLGAEDLGKYVFAFSFTTIFSVFVDVGLSSVLTREVAKYRENANKLLSNIISLKATLAVLVYVLIVILVNVLNYPELTRQLVYITALIMILDTFSTTFWGVLRGNQNLKYESLGIVLFETIVVGLGLTFLYLGFGVLFVTIGTLVGSIIFFIFSFLNMKLRLHLKIKAIFNKQLLGALLKMSIPFALTGIFARLNTQIDTVFLSKLGCSAASVCETNVGLYSIASKITLSIHFIPLAFTAALFPAMSQMFVENKERLVKQFEKAQRYLIIISVPIAAGIISLAPAFVPQIFGAEYTGSVLPLRILMSSLVFLFMTFPIGSLLNAASRQLRNSMHIGFAVLVNIVLNLILIPKFTYVGAASASLASTLVIILLGLWVAPQIIKFSWKKIVTCLIKASVAGGIMTAVLIYLLDSVHFGILIPLGAAIYGILLILLKTISLDEIKHLKSSL